MKLFKLKLFYLGWHYSKAVVDYWRIYKTSLWFVWHFFSVMTLVKTLFAPFERLKERYRGGLDVENFFETLIVNTLMRLVGAFLRSVLITIGLVAWFGVLIFGFLGFFIWLVLPIILTGIFILGVISILKS
jgi:hypothetical protein